MSRRSKLLDKLANHAKDKNWTLDETITLLNQYGFFHTEKKGTSHRVFIRADYPHAIVLAPHGNTIKPVYIRTIRENFAKIEAQNNK